MNPNILAVCTGGGIGDLLAATPAIRALHRHFGNPVSVLASPYAAPVLQGNADVGNVLIDDAATSERALAEQLRPHSFSHAVVFWSTSRVAGAVSRAGIPERVGQARRLYSWRYTHRVPVRTESGDVHSHWTDVQMDYARALGAVAREDDFRIAIHLNSENVAEANELITSAKLEGGFVVLHAARGIPLDRVEWPVEQFANIADALGEAFSLPVVLTGSAADAPTIGRIGGAMKNANTCVAGKTTLMGLAALLGRAQVVAALDSGPMHLAAALGVPTVGVFALRTDLPDRWRPLGSRVAVIRPSYPCPFWHRKETCRSFACYANLAPASVVAAARSVAQTGKPSVAAPT